MLSRICTRLLSGAFVVTGASALFPATAFADALDANIATIYTPVTTSVGWDTQGNISRFPSGSLGPFNRACGIVEGTPTTSGNVVTRNVYILDAGNGSAGTVVLYGYTKTDTITTSNGANTDVVQFTLSQQLTLSLSSQAGASCYMAANDTSVFVATSVGNVAAIVDKATFTESDVNSFSTLHNVPVTAITATSKGDVLVTFGTGPDAGWVHFDDQSNELAVGQFFNFTIVANPANGVTF